MNDPDRPDRPHDTLELPFVLVVGETPPDFNPWEVLDQPVAIPVTIDPDDPDDGAAMMSAVLQGLGAAEPQPADQWDETASSGQPATASPGHRRVDPNWPADANGQRPLAPRGTAGRSRRTRRRSAERPQAGGPGEPQTDGA
jgi:hypothetical protein